VVVDLTTPISAVENKKVVVSSNGNKSPAPNRFRFSIFKRFWDILKDEDEIMFN
jgi:hypothetical protein